MRNTYWTPSFHDRPCADKGLVSYRYGSRFGWIMIGARDNADALKQAARSTNGEITMEKLQIWNKEAGKYTSFENLTV